MIFLPHFSLSPAMIINCTASDRGEDQEAGEQDPSIWVTRFFGPVKGSTTPFKGPGTQNSGL